MARKQNLLGVLPKLTPQEINEMIFFLKRSNYERHRTLCYDALDPKQLGLLPLDEVEAALGLWGTASPGLLSKLKSAS
jgi:hypothetical protein